MIFSKSKSLLIFFFYFNVIYNYNDSIVKHVLLQNIYTSYYLFFLFNFTILFNHLRKAFECYIFFDDAGTSTTANNVAISFIRCLNRREYNQQSNND